MRHRRRGAKSIRSGQPMTTPPPDPAAVEEPHRVSTGNVGLDDILGGGFDADRLYLVEGRPGTGKTTLALQYLLDGVRRGEKGLYITLSESERELRVVAARHGWSLDGVAIFELVPPEATLDPDRELTGVRIALMVSGQASRCRAISTA